MSTASSPAILADIGATNARFALLLDGVPTAITTYAVADYASPIDALRAFLAGPAHGHHPKTAVIAAAGPVVAGRVTMTNAAWTVDTDRIRHGLGFYTVHVINDFEAQAWALPALQPDDLFTLGPAVASAHGTMAVLGAGTGFGLAALASAPGGEVILVTEGGHATLSSENQREDAVILALRERLFNVSVERVLSGPGLIHLYHAIAIVDGLKPTERTSAAIVSHALAGDCETSRQTLEMFCAFLGSVAGNIALTLGAVGGVYVAGGIVPEFTEFLRHSAFRERFEAKGDMVSYLQRIPTSVITHKSPAFVGLARRASHVA